MLGIERFLRERGDYEVAIGNFRASSVKSPKPASCSSRFGGRVPSFLEARRKRNKEKLQ